MDLKQWSSDVWFLYIIDHATRYSSSCVIYTKEKEVVKKFLENWITIFGNPGKILVDSGGEFCNKSLLHFLRI